MTTNKNSETKIWGIVPAAGVGERMAADVPKQYLLLDGKPVLQHVIEKLIHHSQIEKIVVALHPDDQHWQTLPIANNPKLIIVQGGAVRAESVHNALQALKIIAHADDWVLVHDAVRPCIQTESIDSLIDNIMEHPVGGLLGVSICDTLKHVDDNNQVKKTLPREQVWQAQTPQMFRFSLLEEALEKAQVAGYAVTDEASAVEQLGHAPLMVTGDSRNIKVTFPGDIHIAEQFLKDANP